MISVLWKSISRVLKGNLCHFNISYIVSETIKPSPRKTTFFLSTKSFAPCVVRSPFLLQTNHN